ncbi:MAG: hypothetical protein IJ825_01875 [Oscillospiraceae bacterium]|nr:hypothetical protein [Oscillospiraceae bacterium]
MKKRLRISPQNFQESFLFHSTFSPLSNSRKPPPDFSHFFTFSPHPVCGGSDPVAAPHRVVFHFSAPSTTTTIFIITYIHAVTRRLRGGG